VHRQQQQQRTSASPQQPAQQLSACIKQQQPQQSSQLQQWQQQPRCSLDVAESLLEPAVLLSGTADGHLQIHSADGLLLFQQRFAATPVLDILVRPHCSGEADPAAVHSGGHVFSKHITYTSSCWACSSSIRGGVQAACIEVSTNRTSHIKYWPCSSSSSGSGSSYGRNSGKVLWEEADMAWHS
jgi:hypothetical protein